MSRLVKFLYLFTSVSLSNPTPTKDAWMHMNEKYLDAHVLHFNAREGVMSEKNDEN